MKKKYLDYAGIVSAAILISMFIMVFYNMSPLLFPIPVITVDPVSGMNLDDNNYLVLTGKTNLQPQTVISLDLTMAGGVRPEDRSTVKPVIKGDVWITGSKDGWNTWRGTINLSSLEPGEYQANFKSIRFEDNYAKKIESGPLTSFTFKLGNGNSPDEYLRKKETKIKPFIRINQELEEQEVLKFTGTANLPPGIKLGWKIGGPGSSSSGISGYQGVTYVTQGIEGINRWSVTYGNRSEISGIFNLTVFSMTGERGFDSESGRVSSSREFNLTAFANPAAHGDESQREGTRTSEYLTIDALPEIKVNGKYVITGTSNLPPGEILFFEVTPAIQKDNYSFTINPRDQSEQGYFSGIAGSSEVQNGTGEENLWAIDIETYCMTAGSYELNVSTVMQDPGTIPVRPGSVSDSEGFIVHGGS